MMQNALCSRGVFFLPPSPPPPSPGATASAQGRQARSPRLRRRRGASLTAPLPPSRGRGPAGVFLAMVSLLWLSLALAGEPQHGLALGTTVQYPPGFAHYAYADPQAVQGGVLTLSSPGSFDKLNPFSLKGRAPLLLSTLVFESLTDSSLDEPFA